MHEPLLEYLSEIADLPCAPLLLQFVARVTSIEPKLHIETGAFGLRFHAADVLFCEISVFGELFLVRVGADRAAEYRVRSPETAASALDALLCAHVGTWGENAPHLPEPSAPRVVAPPATGPHDAPA